jgi:hypothetical protein
VDGVLGISYGKASTVDLGILPELYSLLSVLFLLGGLLFGIAAFRAAILPRWAGGLLALSATLTPLAALLPHHLQRLAGIPIGLAVAWLGYALLAERGETVAQPLPDRGSRQARQSGAD